MPSADDGVGPAFDTMTLSRPTTRKLVGGWMDRSNMRTLVLPLPSRLRQHYHRPNAIA